MDAERPTEPLPVPQEAPLRSAPGARLGLILGICSLLLFWVSFYHIVDRSGGFLFRELGLAVALGSGAVAWLCLAGARDAALREPRRYKASVAKGSGCLMAGGLGSMVLAGLIYFLIFNGSRTRAIEYYVRANVDQMSSELAVALDDLQAAPAPRKPGLAKTIYPDSAEGNLQMTQDAVQFVMGQPLAQSSRNAYGKGPAFLVGPTGHQLGTVYIDLAEAWRPRDKNPVLTVTGVYKGRQGQEDRIVKVLQVRP